MFVEDRAMIWTCRLASDMSSSALPKTRGRAALPSKALIDVQPADGPAVLEKRRAYRDMERRHMEPASLRSCLRRKPASATSYPRQRIEALGYAIEAEGAGGVVAFVKPISRRRLKQRAKAFPVIWIPGTLRHRDLTRNDLAAAETAARSGNALSLIRGSSRNADAPHRSARACRAARSRQSGSSPAPDSWLGVRYSRPAETDEGSSWLQQAEFRPLLR